MKTYRAKLNKDVKGVYGISLVHDPAMEGDFLKFGKQEEIKFAQVDTEKRLLMGLVLEPNKLIYRNQGGREFQVFFTEQDIEDVAYNFQMQSYQKNSTIEHDGNNIEGLTFVETWTVKDTFKDQSANYGMTYPVGSWVAMMKVDNDEIWNNYIKTGKVKGFSIDAFMQLEEININQLNKVNMSDDKNKSLTEKIALFVQSIADGGKVQMSKEDVKNVLVELSADMVKTFEESSLEQNKKLEELEVKYTEVKKELEEKEKYLSLSADEKEVIKKETAEAIEKSSLELSKSIEALKLELAEIKEQPASKKIVSAPSQVDFSKMTALEKYKYHKANEQV